MFTSHPSLALGNLRGPWAKNTPASLAHKKGYTKKIRCSDSDSYSDYPKNQHSFGGDPSQAVHPSDRRSGLIGQLEKLRPAASGDPNRTLVVCRAKSDRPLVGVCHINPSKLKTLKVFFRWRLWLGNAELSRNQNLLLKGAAQTQRIKGPDLLLAGTCPAYPESACLLIHLESTWALTVLTAPGRRHGLSVNLLPAVVQDLGPSALEAIKDVCHGQNSESVGNNRGSLNRILHTCCPHYGDV